MRTLLRVSAAAVLGIGLLFIALQNAVASAPTILVFGDSLSAAHGIRPEEGWVALLAQRLQTQGYGYRVVNASVSGETSSGGLERLPRALQLQQPQIVVLELGANDGLRGLPVTTTRDNLTRMLQLAQAAKAKVLLVGIRLPPNYGARFNAQFERLFPQLAAQFHVPLVPFLLQGVALDPQLMQEDGLHPAAAGEPKVLDTVWLYLKPMLQRNNAEEQRR